jgi:hypothetical protein
MRLDKHERLWVGLVRGFWPVSFRLYEQVLDGFQVFVEACGEAFGLAFRFMEAVQEGTSRRLVR